jgi:hypothetical protein
VDDLAIITGGDLMVKNLTGKMFIAISLPGPSSGRAWLRAAPVNKWFYFLFDYRALNN